MRCGSIWSNRIPLQSSPIDLGSHRIWHARGKKKTGARIPWYSPDAGSKIQRIPQQNNLRFPISVRSRYDLRGKDLGSTGSLMKMLMQYATSTKILDIRSSMSPVSFHSTRKKSQEASKIHTTHQKRLFNGPRLTWANEFSLRKIQDPQDPAATILNKIQDPQDPAKLCGNDPDPLDPSTNANKESRIRQDPGSWILQTLDPRPFLVSGTCPMHTCITHCHLFVNLCGKISSRYIKNDQNYDYDMRCQN